MTSTLTPPVRSEEKRKKVRRAAWSGWAGSALEYYDFALYAQAAGLIFPTIFFPTGNATVAIIASLATYAVGYVARPIGAVVLGAWGDRKGRKNVLVLAMLLMGVSTFVVGLLPTYSQIGILAPLFLVLLRLVQGFAVAGELGGAGAMIVEHSPEKSRGFFASFTLQGSQVGSILATGVMLPLSVFLPEQDFQTWGWRVPFLLSAMVVLAGFIIRAKVEEPEVFTSTITNVTVKQPFPLFELLRHHSWLVVRCVLITFANVVGMATTIFGAAYATQEGYGNGFTTSEFLWVTLLGNFAAALTIPLFGALSDRIGRRVFMVVGPLGGGLLCGFYLQAIEDGDLARVFVLIVVIQGVLFQMWNATFATFFQEQFPTSVRVTGFAVSQNVGLMIASFFPAMFTAVAPPGAAHVPLIVGGIAFGIAALASVATLLTRESKGRTLEDIDRG